jgi:hypothetical protein
MNDTLGQPAAIPAPATTVDLRRVLRTWWPLAASWILMGLELPMVSAVLARLADPKVNLAAYGGVVFPLSMLIEAPIIMLLSASTALARDRDSYLFLRRTMHRMGMGLTVFHLLLATTPLFDVVVGGIMKAPMEVRGPARLGLLFMTPWTYSIAYRRLQQGVMIRAGRSHLVGTGTLVRLLACAAMLAIGAAIGSIPGTVVGAAAVASGVLAEAIYAGFLVRPTLRALTPRNPGEPALSMKKFLPFYVPLALTSLLHMIAMPIGAAGIGRLPRALDSLAAWPVINGLVFLLRGMGIAFNEVVVALLDKPGAAGALRRFAGLLAGATSAILIVIAATPLSTLYFREVTGLPEGLVLLARVGLAFAVLSPAVGAWQSWHQGILVHGHRTRGIPEAIGIALLVMALCLGLATLLQLPFPGLYAVIVATLLGQSLQLIWLARRSLPLRRGPDANIRD